MKNLVFMPNIDLGNGRLVSNTDPIQNSSEYGPSPLIVQAPSGGTSIWVAMIQHAGTLDLTDTDSITLTFGFEYLG